MSVVSSASGSIVQRLHRVAVLRQIARRLCRGWTVRQGFHGGVICCDAVEHSWAWTGKVRYESFDRELQDALLLLSKRYEMLLDLGCNVGAMMLSVVLRNPAIRAVGVDPNRRALALLRRSIALNRLAARVQVMEAAVADRDGEMGFDESGSVVGHVTAAGRKVATVEFPRLVNDFSGLQRCLVKIDVEGFEIVLVEQLSRLQFRQNLCLVVELHPLGFNGVGNPGHCVKALLDAGARVADLRDRPIGNVAEDAFTQVVARW